MFQRQDVFDIVYASLVDNIEGINLGASNCAVAIAPTPRKSELDAAPDSNGSSRNRFLAEANNVDCTFNNLNQRFQSQSE